MGLLDAAQRFLGMSLIDRPPDVALYTPIEAAVDRVIHARDYPRMGAWRLPSVSEALTVPAIYQAVQLISNTVGALSMQAYRNGERLSESERPRLIVRPNPLTTPRDFLRDTAYAMATLGEAWWWIAKRDGDGVPQALYPMNPVEVDVQENRDDPRYPRIRWRHREMKPSEVVQLTLQRDLGALRGHGPLQACRAAVSVSVEAQTWAANFFGDGGAPRDIVKWAGLLDPTPRDDTGQPDPDTGLSEADRLKAQYIARDSNTPLIIDERIDSITHPTLDQAGAQMLEARNFANGDVARMFSIPGPLLEYSIQGSSLTYQNVATEFEKFVRTCLWPNYLEPIEQALSDLLTRSTVARFNLEGLLRADVKTRFEVHKIAIEKGIYDPEHARQVEGLTPGDIENAPVQFAPPIVIPRAASTAVRCPTCNKLVARALGPGSELECPRCKAEVKVA